MVLKIIIKYTKNARAIRFKLPIIYKKSPVLISFAIFSSKGQRQALPAQFLIRYA